MSAIVEVTFVSGPTIEVEFPSIVTVGQSWLTRVRNEDTGTWFRLRCTGSDTDPKFEWEPET